MRKDIEIPEVKDVHVAAVYEQHSEYKTMDWNAYIINEQNVPLEMVLIVSSGYSDVHVTPPMRHTIKVLPAKSFAKIEFLQEKVLKLNNEFAITFFADGKMFERTFKLEANSAKESAISDLPLIPYKGVLAK